MSQVKLSACHLYISAFVRLNVYSALVAISVICINYFYLGFLIFSSEIFFLLSAGGVLSLPGPGLSRTGGSVVPGREHRLDVPGDNRISDTGKIHPGPGPVFLGVVQAFL
ncbi:MAG: hypothetical protein NUW07_07765 [Candidatus Saccharicenans sp.]|nr:hypothetical protein [Candidatus Saccharicenans sp.]MDH7493972.1 hypothetical protein [Candidatus Saccharicenans sp.]